MLGTTTQSCEGRLMWVPPLSTAIPKFTLYYGQPRELEIDPQTGMKNYIANGRSFCDEDTLS